MGENVNDESDGRSPWETPSSVSGLDAWYETWDEVRDEVRNEVWDDAWVDAWEEDAFPSTFVVGQQATVVGSSPSVWNNGTSYYDPLGSGCIDPQLLPMVAAETDNPIQDVPGQDVAGLGSVDGFQVAIETH